MRASPRSTPTSDSLRQVLTPNPYSSSTHLSTLPLILTHMHLLYKVSVYLRATKRKVPPPSSDEEIEKRHVKRARSTPLFVAGILNAFRLFETNYKLRNPALTPTLTYVCIYMSVLCTNMETVARTLERLHHNSDILTIILSPMWSVFREVIMSHSCQRFMWLYFYTLCERYSEFSN
ncbi:hypothetical protein ALC60_13659 [Trachymyrmex zeteki]|uniref:Uncharacterized protein n=1 Tax=Mycetomoellerius zeteki TaxID=64791 RepID=A0A151WHL1_9HYME|nr:hypothetical protein ALC60_13659 [Trachymyrmex zeteki]